MPCTSIGLPPSILIFDIDQTPIKSSSTCTPAPTLGPLRSPALFHGQEDQLTSACTSSIASILAFPRVPHAPRPPCLSPSPTAFLKTHALLSHRPVSDARTDHREATMLFLGELGGLGTGGDAIHPRRARNLQSTVLAPACLASLRRVHFAYAVSAAVLFLEDVLRAVVFADRWGPGMCLERH
ncbi:hypothetical protein DFH08DRAFT_1046578 [Mycena albidolilacea]|uniref:Uncharacterized protein n=1 Tax=Mycena albidolilacea TaxID=1033008 RepID=A0AAD6Z815_9AGAR|nr:hypothetical protein DFH08DRAFT_1046578 [Mycena albidolilacea]